MSIDILKRKSIAKFPRIPQSSALETSKIMQSYLTRMRGLRKLEYPKPNKIQQKSIPKPIPVPKVRVSNDSPIQQTIILETIQRYIESMRFLTTQRSTKRYRRLVSKVLDLIRNYPSINQKLFESEDPTKLIIDSDTLKIRLTDQHHPILSQIIDRIEDFTHDQKSFELFSMGHRIKSLKTGLINKLQKSSVESQHRSILKIRDRYRYSETFPQHLANTLERIGGYSIEIHKRQDLFGKLNEVVDLISFGGARQQ